MIIFASFIYQSIVLSCRDIYVLTLKILTTLFRLSFYRSKYENNQPCDEKNADILLFLKMQQYNHCQNNKYLNKRIEENSDINKLKTSSFCPICTTDCEHD